MKVPLCAPEPVHEPADCAVVLFIVPAANPLPVAVQVMLLIAIVLLPAVRSPPARQVRVTAPEALVWASAVTETGFSFAVIGGVVGGLAAAKLMLPLPSVRLAVALTVAFTVRFWVAVTAWAGLIRPSVVSRTAVRPATVRAGQVCHRSKSARRVWHRTSKP